MKLKKYPVISKNNNEYYVTIEDFHYHIDFNDWEIKIFKLKKSIFGINIYKKIHQINWSIRTYNEWTYTELVQEAVNGYEEIIENKMNENSKLNNKIKEFKTWDGKC